MSIAFLNLRFEVSDTSDLFTDLSYTGKGDTSFQIMQNPLISPYFNKYGAVQ